MDIYEDDQSKHDLDRHTMDSGVVSLPLIHLPLLNASMCAYAGFVFDEPHTWIPIYLEGTHRSGGLLTNELYYYNQGAVLVIVMSTYLLPHRLHKSQPIRFTGGFLGGEGVIYLFHV